MRYAYLFEARGIQRYLFASGRLRDMLGGSELIDYICSSGGFLDQLLQELQLEPQVVRKAGGSFYLVLDSEEDARRLRSCWRLASAEWMPGIECIDALICGNSSIDAVANGLRILQVERNRPMSMEPRPGPITRRSPRTGLAAITTDRGEPIDAAIARIRDFSTAEGQGALIDRFLDEDVKWPVNFETDAPASVRFPMEQHGFIGLVHADGNQLGSLLRTVNSACAGASNEQYADVYRTFSDALAQAMREATREACRKALLPHAVDGVMPARPLLMGGDDLTVIVRADLALPFTRTWLAAFESETQQALSSIRDQLTGTGLPVDDSFPELLTSCAGICYMKPSQPFSMGYELAETLCERAKEASRAAAGGKTSPSAVSWHRVQDSLILDAAVLFDHNHVIATPDETLETALGVYALHEQQGLPALADLDAAYRSLQGALNDKPLRNIATLLRSDLALAARSYDRWRQIAGRESPQALNAFDTALTALLGDVRPDLPFSTTSPGRSPLEDLICLRGLASQTEVEV